MTGINGYVAGYDPGGNGKHGLVVGEYDNGRCVDVATCKKARRPARGLMASQDLRRVEKSVIRPNSAYISMTVNGWLSFFRPLFR